MRRRLRSKVRLRILAHVIVWPMLALALAESLVEYRAVPILMHPDTWVDPQSRTRAALMVMFVNLATISLLVLTTRPILFKWAYPHEVRTRFARIKKAELSRLLLTTEDRHYLFAILFLTATYAFICFRWQHWLFAQTGGFGCIAISYVICALAIRFAIRSKG